MYGATKYRMSHKSKTNCCYSWVGDGSNGYVLVFRGHEIPILSGYLAERAPFNTMESTRE